MQEEYAQYVMKVQIIRSKRRPPRFFVNVPVLPGSWGLMLSKKLEFSVMEAIEFKSKKRLVTQAVGLT